MNLLILSVLLHFVHKIMKKNPPKEINSFFGFRTRKSTKNEESWHLAQQLLGEASRKKVVPVCLAGILFLSIEILALAVLKNENFFVTALLAESLILVLVLCYMIYEVNKKL